MSSRPRPVTATVTKPRWMDIADADAIAYAHRHSLDSSGSTESLTSILGHSSYESIPSEEEEERIRHEAYFERNARLEKEFRELNKKVEQIVITDRKTASDPKLSSWEMWIINKTKEDRYIKKLNQQKEREERLKKEDEEREKQKKLKEVEKKIQKWIEKKNGEMKRQKRLQREEALKKEMDKKRQEQQTVEKAQEKIQKWMEKKQRDECLRKKAEKLRQREEKKKKAQKKKEAEEEYEKWKKMAKKRPKSAPSSVGFIGGKLTQYHDTGAYPTPSYCNPIPWQPIHIPTEKKTDKPKRPKPKKYVWNPNKYY
ncbi:coiled-coil domain-containing protein 34-like [Gigantopelta aegis]|uniref:coiled-coil domain-containing protein 34-like n=1 Tax=Gigantopelta aegis TaxID=1735272 RepID=UPI001B888413|nr:coiled-coil domain-containing protein 34-like [Gigantopelta aegis]